MSVRRCGGGHAGRPSFGVDDRQLEAVSVLKQRQRAERPGSSRGRRECDDHEHAHRRQYGHGDGTNRGRSGNRRRPVLLTHDRVSGNTGIANGPSGFAQGGGIWNGLLFGGPTSPLTVRDTVVTGNLLRGSAGVTLSGAGIYTVGFPTTLTNSILAFNRPDQCAGC